MSQNTPLVPLFVFVGVFLTLFGLGMMFKATNDNSVVLGAAIAALGITWLWSLSQNGKNWAAALLETQHSASGIGMAVRVRLGIIFHAVRDSVETQHAASLL
jgi:hypothetical protein